MEPVRFPPWRSLTLGGPATGANTTCRPPTVQDRAGLRATTRTAPLPEGAIALVLPVDVMLGERVLRPALVGVSKGGPKVAPASGANNDNAKAPAQES